MKKNLPNPEFQKEFEALMQRFGIKPVSPTEETPAEVKAKPNTADRYLYDRMPWDDLYPWASVLVSQLYMRMQAPNIWVSELEGGESLGALVNEDFEAVLQLDLFEAEQMYLRLPEKVRAYQSNVTRVSMIDMMLCVLGKSLGRVGTADVLNNLQYSGDLGDKMASQFFESSVGELMLPDNAFPDDGMNRMRKRALIMINDRIKVFVEAGVFAKCHEKCTPTIKNLLTQEHEGSVYEVVNSQEPQQSLFS